VGGTARLAAPGAGVVVGSGSGSGSGADSGSGSSVGVGGSLAGHFAVIALLVAGSVAMLAHVWVSGHPAVTVLCQCGDPGQAVWFMSWVPWALSHGHDPLFTTRMLAGQGGANLLESTSYLLPSFVLAPVTWLFGPNVSFNVAETLAPVLSGWAMYAATGRLTRHWVARAAVALGYGFSPFVVGSVAYGHLNFSWLWFPPLLFLACHELLVGDRRSPAVLGSVMGLLVALQFFTGTEPLLITVIVAAIGVVCALLMAPRATWARRRRLLIGFGTGVGVAAVLLAYPLWYLTHGPRRVVGEPWRGNSVFGNPIGNIVHAGTGVHASSGYVRIGGYFGPAGPNGSFLGWWLLGFLALSLPLFVGLRRRIAWPIALAGAVAWLCSLGTVLSPSLHTAWWLPWQYVHDWPLLQQIAPGRFSFMVVATAMLLFALALDCWVEVLSRWARSFSGRSAGRARSWSATLGSGAFMIAVALIVGLPVAQEFTFPLTMNSGQVPVWFMTTARQLRPGTELLTYPYASSGVPDAMYWQAVDGLRFALVGGRAMIPGADGRHSVHVDPLAGSVAVLMDSSFGIGPPSPPSAAVVRQLRASIHRWKVDAAVVVARGRAPAWALVWFAEALGRMPVMQHEAAVFWVRSEGPRPVVLPPGVVRRCSAQPVSAVGLAAAVSCLGSAFSDRVP
jgi:hypothetical protein